MRVFIGVKGAANVAETEAVRRGIDMTVTAESSKFPETYCEAPITELPKIRQWYAEYAGRGGTPPPGSCLWYAART